MLSLLMLTALSSSACNLPAAALPEFLSAADRDRIIRLQRGRALFDTLP